MILYNIIYSLYSKEYKIIMGVNDVSDTKKYDTL